MRVDLTDINLVTEDNNTIADIEISELFDTIIAEQQNGYNEAIGLRVLSSIIGYISASDSTKERFNFFDSGDEEKDRVNQAKLLSIHDLDGEFAKYLDRKEIIVFSKVEMRGVLSTAFQSAHKTARKIIDKERTVLSAQDESQEDSLGFKEDLLRFIITGNNTYLLEEFKHPEISDSERSEVVSVGLDVLIEEYKGSIPENKGKIAAKYAEIASKLKEFDIEIKGGNPEKQDLAEDGAQGIVAEANPHDMRVLLKHVKENNLLEAINFIEGLENNQEAQPIDAQGGYEILQAALGSYNETGADLLIRIKILREILKSQKISKELSDKAIYDSIPNNPNIELIRMLSDLNLNANDVSNDGINFRDLAIEYIRRVKFSKLHQAIYHRREDIANMLIEKGADLDIRVEDGGNAYLHTVRKLGDVGYMFGGAYDGDRRYFHLLFAAINSGMVNVVANILDKNSGVVNILDPYLYKYDFCNIRPLYHATALGNIEIARLLLGYGCDFNCELSAYDYLYHPIINGDVEMVKFILDAGVNPSYFDASWASGIYSPLSLAKRINGHKNSAEHKEILRLLEERASGNIPFYVGSILAARFFYLSMTYNLAQRVLGLYCKLWGCVLSLLITIRDITRQKALELFPARIANFIVLLINTSVNPVFHAAMVSMLLFGDYVPMALFLLDIGLERCMPRHYIINIVSSALGTLSFMLGVVLYIGQLSYVPIMLLMCLFFIDLHMMLPLSIFLALVEGLAVPAVKLLLTEAKEVSMIALESISPIITYTKDVKDYILSFNFNIWKSNQEQTQAAAHQEENASMNRVVRGNPTVLQEAESSNLRHPPTSMVGRYGISSPKQSYRDEEAHRSTGRQGEQVAYMPR